MDFFASKKKLKLKKMALVWIHMRGTDGAIIIPLKNMTP